MEQPSWYRLGEGTLGIRSADRSLALRFQEIYGECEVAGPGEGPRVVCTAEFPDRDSVRVVFDDPEPLDHAGFIPFVFPERGYEPVARPDGSVLLRLPDSGGEIIFSNGSLTAPAGAAWQPLVANLAVSRLLRLQRSLLFFHAASFSVRGRGVLVCGPKRSGKTTLAMALAVAGHTLFGDEVAALRITDRLLIPFRRSLAVREGLATAGINATLAQAAAVPERFPDGEIRRRLQISAVSPMPALLHAPLTTVLILRHFSDATMINRLPAGPEFLRSLTPMAVSIWDRPAGALAVRLMGAVAGAKLYEVYPGPPDEAAAAIERLLED